MALTCQLLFYLFLYICNVLSIQNMTLFNCRKGTYFNNQHGAVKKRCLVYQVYTPKRCGFREFQK
ncbi:hypothetical protein CW304_28240 [Bacillus sp. UFRGS-B20]|nr:hypothetical protein CW304_28240 [Bacillus sp. UFRGS-B20]